MQLKIFKYFLNEVIREGIRMQRHDINGKPQSKYRFTQTQVLSAIAAIGLVVIVPKGFSENFAGYSISFLGIFVGLFTTIVITLYEKGQSIISNNQETEFIAKARDRQLKNYIKQFNGLTAFSILIAIFLIVLLMCCLLHPIFQFDFSLLEFSSSVGIPEISLALKVFLLATHRFFVFYLLLNFFIITIFAVSSYFSYLSSEFKK